jgi:hypothetical protein
MITKPKAKAKDSDRISGWYGLLARTKPTNGHNGV